MRGLWSADRASPLTAGARTPSSGPRSSIEVKVSAIGGVAQLRMPELLGDVATRIVVPVTALPGADMGEPCKDTFALDAWTESS